MKLTEKWFHDWFAKECQKLLYMNMSVAIKQAYLAGMKKALEQTNREDILTLEE